MWYQAPPKLHPPNMPYPCTQTSFFNFATGPEIIVGPETQILNANETLSIHCTARNNPGATRMLMITWVFIPVDQMATVIMENDMRVTRDNLASDTFMSTFRIERATSSDGGLYSCHAYNREFTDAVTENATVTVFCECINLTLL